jgi:hypothetical protein
LWYGFAIWSGLRSVSRKYPPSGCGLRFSIEMRFCVDDDSVEGLLGQGIGVGG